MRKISCLLGLILFLASGFAHAVTFAEDDTYGVPLEQSLQVEAPGVLVNDTIDGVVPEDGVLAAELVTGVANGTLTCPADAALQLCVDGSFEYIPGPGFSGFDSFTYRAISDTASLPATVTLTACTGGPQIFTCWQESSYLTKLAENGYGSFLEGFEGAEWDPVRTPNTAPSITSQGIIWTTNHPDTNEITTSTGPALSGLWGGYDSKHGSATGTINECDVTLPPAFCFFHDGLSGAIPTGGNKLQAVGGYITGVTGANIAIIIDGLVQNTIGKLPDSGHHFFGLIDTSGTGFNKFEFRELDGKVGQEIFIFGDDFIVSSSDIISVNNPPIANAGADQSVFIGDTVTLDGSASSDVDGDPLSYSWLLTSVPLGSSATLDTTDPVHPTFVADVSGSYVAQLIVNDGLLDSVPDTVSISTTNSAPVANAGTDQSVFVGDTVTLDGSTSSDVDGDPLSYSWSFTSLPVGSSTTLDTTDPLHPTFVADVSGSYVAQLIVNDGLLDSAPDTVSISTTNSAPVADAGTDQSVLVGDTVTLDGSASNDVDGDPLSYSWSFTSLPVGSSTTMDMTDPLHPTFVADVSGSYVAQLIVNDGLLDSVPDTVNITTTNSAPVANAGTDQSVLVGDTVTLDGSASSDVDGDPLSYIWSFTSVPVGSSATLDITDPVHPTFVADVSGSYVAQLIVNDGLLDSNPDTVSISTTNSTPVANAGTDQSVLLGDTVTLDGSGSSDVDGDMLSYNWSLTSVPLGSTTALDMTDPVHPTFVADVSGSYVAQLIVNDGLLDSAPDTVSITTINSAPVANAGTDQSVLVGDTVTLDGSTSNDVDGDPLSYNWSLTSVPLGSTTTLDMTDPVHPTFVADVSGSYVAQLIVNDGLLDSVPDTVNITTTNSTPVANAGTDQSVLVGATVTLDGSGSSDVDGDLLSYSWSLTSIPVGSTTALDMTDPVHPTFVADASGSYVAQLIVNDGLLDSAPDTVSISTTNSAPVANAGTDQSVLVGDTVSLDGSGSNDVDGDPLSYNWSLTSVPVGSTTTLDMTDPVHPTFIADVSGSYVAQLIVNDGLLDSIPDTVTISTTNSAPVANAGSDQSVLVGDTVSLDGSASSDVDGDLLSFHWSLTSVPAGSTAAISDPTAVSPVFIADVSGNYVAQLIVNDGLLDSAPDTVTISTTNSAPVANAGSDQSVLVGDSVILDGSGSNDVDGDPLSYSWSLTSVPVGSTAVLSDPTAVSPVFIADVSGSYVAQLIVNDGLLDSAPDTVTISTTNSAPVASAGTDQSVLVGDTVSLDGSASSDVDGDPLSYSWSFTSVPAGSSTTLDMTDPVHPTFVADVSGSYVVQLIVNDGLLDSVPDTVNISASTSTSAPVANAGTDQSVLVGDAVILDGSGSSDVDGDPLSYSWLFTSVPVGSVATLSDPTAVNPVFIADVSGSYVAQLVVNDGTVDSDPDSITITVETGGCGVLSGDLDGDCDVDRDDMNIILAARNTPADGPDDARDLDGDGIITALDARTLVTLCSRTRCAVE